MLGNMVRAKLLNQVDQVFFISYDQASFDALVDALNFEHVKYHT